MFILFLILAVAFGAFGAWLVWRFVGHRTPSAKLPVAVVLAMVAASACCLRYEVFASESDPPAALWRDWGILVAENVSPLENAPIVTPSVEYSDGWGLTLRNQGSTTLKNWSDGQTRVQLLHELEDRGKWIPMTIEGWGPWADTYEISPGETAELTVGFMYPRRERILICFQEEGTNRSSLVVVATKSRGVIYDGGKIAPFLGVAFGAFCVWLGVRIINRRERWAKCTVVAICLMTAYVLSIGPAAWITMGSQPGERLWDAYHAIYCPVIAVGSLDEGKEGEEPGPLSWVLSNYLHIWGGAPVAYIDT